MRRIELKAGIIYLTYGFIVLELFYRLYGESTAFLPLDIKYSFSGAPFSPRYILLPEIILALFCIYVITNKAGSLRFRWKIRIGKWQWEFGALKAFYLNSNRIMYAGLALAVGLGILLFVQNHKPAEAEWEKYPIAHAMGSIDGDIYTNSMDAFYYNYGLGHRVFEVDFRMTSDGKMVCVHDWNVVNEEGNEGYIPSEEEFIKTPIFGKYTSATWKDVLMLMAEYEDIYIITDTKSSAEEKVAEQFSYIVDTAYETGTEEVLDRIIVQIYNDNMLNRVKQVYDFPMIIYTLYLTWDGEYENFQHYCRFCKENGISYITMWAELAEPEVLEMAHAYGITIFVHTVNDLDDAEELIKRGVKGIYTDDLSPDMIAGRIHEQG